MGDASHGGLYYLGIVNVCGVGGTIDAVDAKPIGYTDDGSYVAWVLDTIKCQREMTFWGYGAVFAGISSTANTSCGCCKKLMRWSSSLVTSCVSAVIIVVAKI